MDVWRHGTIAGCLRTALQHYAIHFARQGLLALPPDAFEFTKRNRDAVR